MAENTVKLKIADVIIKLQSSFPLKRVSEKEKEPLATERFNNFSYSGRQKSHISIDVKIVKKLPRICNTKHLFTTYHFRSGDENWRLLKRDNTYVYKSPIEDREQLMLVNNTFDRVTAYLLPKRDKGWVWNTPDIIYDFLQILLINYFAQRNLGVFVHAIGVKDLNGKGLLFAGKSGTGKTATAELWHNHSKAMVLNDDRIIVRKNKDKFFIYGSPWHGEFGDYLNSRIESAPLVEFFFIHHASRNIVRRISEKEAFSRLYPVLFPTFWDRSCLENIVSFCQDLIKKSPCFVLGFVNNKKVIKFIRKI